ncbi:maltooligosyl trehalose synthase [Steroidobacter agaridevorans]|uniref:Maltooligosyl trehalose synthase n=1 Tax=Steroidobacter agaridevorans TaxID=2695856 RepID=A0A829YEW1_9GAMM|nr:malto-oligosyltrehalose synthase [Steroidobacter agaridevorans]GFE81473.1 maltooligosyl trehalose synthase [Steroidobacter agaridevorans]
MSSLVPTEPGARFNIPRATYRLQFNHQFTFNDASQIVPYLARLGISHVYASPILKARPGSMHGYDVVDHSQLNPELGTREDFDRLVQKLHEHGLGLIVDIVPNHLGVMGNDNVWWLDVLENGPAARYAYHFDIDWRPNRSSMRDRILVPILGDAYGMVLERGELQIEFDAAAGSFSVRYYDHRLPIDPREYPRVFSQPIPEELLPPDDAHRADFESLLNSFSNLPPRDDTSADAVAVRHRDKEAHKRRLARLIERGPEVLRHINESVTRINGTPGQTESFDALDALLEAQAYRLSYWRVAVDEINYRRFFDVNDLAALRMNERSVFDATHHLIFDLIDAGSIDGLRIDHSDGLYDPDEYFLRLQERFGGGPERRPLYVVTEKILAAHERLPESWRVHGTTGYDYAALQTTWLVCGDEETRMTRRYRTFTENEASFEAIAYESKRLVMRSSLAAEVEVLATQLDRIAHLNRHTSDFTRAALREAIREVIACFPVYRTYISARGLGEEDQRIIHWATGLARRRSAGAEVSVFDFLRDVLLGTAADLRLSSHRQAMLEFAMKFQQVTAPVTAKGVEDTAFYRFNRLICLNEVGGDPSRFGVSSTALHQANLERARLWPHSMLATSTHDTKRSEDVRARIAVLSELPDLWKQHLSRWSQLNRNKRRQVDDAPAPDREDEYLLYQTLAGLWSAELPTGQLIERLQAYMTKAGREAKRSTSWINPNADYEAAVNDFIAQLLNNPERNAFLRDFTSFVGTIAFFGRINSLVTTVLKITSPGVPDFYQGTELPAFTLVDPDNRAPVDFDAASARLDSLASVSEVHALFEESHGAQAKLYVTAKLLQFRAADAALFALGSYQPLQVEGEKKDHVFAFARAHEGRTCVVIVPRWSARLMAGEMRLPIGEIWADTRVLLGNADAGELHDVLTSQPARATAEDGSLRLADVLSALPLAVLKDS